MSAGSAGCAVLTTSCSRWTSKRLVQYVPRGFEPRLFHAASAGAPMGVPCRGRVSHSCTPHPEKQCSMFVAIWLKAVSAQHQCTGRFAPWPCLILLFRLMASQNLGEKSATMNKLQASSQARWKVSSKGPDSKGPVKKAGASNQVELVTEQAKRVLAMSKGRVRVPLEDLGPALFNRGGFDTCGTHCNNIAERIVTVEGFATYRYEAGFCHEPDPLDPLSVQRHGNLMADKDSCLPRLPARALKGVFAKTHLVTFLQLLKAGRMPALTKFIKGSGQEGGASSQAGVGASSQAGAGATSHAELLDVLEHGIYMIVFPWEAVRDHRDDIVLLMASNNFDNGHGLADSEWRTITMMRGSILTVDVPLGQTQWDVVSSKVSRISGQRWQEKDLLAFWEFAKTTVDLQLGFLTCVWNFAKCEDVLRVDSAFYGGLAKLPAKHQWCRAALTVCQFLSARDDCLLVGGKDVAGAVDKLALQRLGAKSRTDEQKASYQAVEDFMGDIMETYYTPWASSQADSPFSAETWLKGLAQFALKVGSSILKDKGLDLDAKCQLETKLRACLSGSCTERMPERVLPLSDEQGQGKSQDIETVVSSKSTGAPVVSLKRLATEAGLEIHAEVVKKAARQTECENGDAGQQDAGLVGVVKGIDESGVLVSWDDAAPVIVAVDDLAIAPQKSQKKAEAPSQEAAVLSLPPVKWAPVSSQENGAMMWNFACVALYQVYLATSSGHDDLHLVESTGKAPSQGPVSIYARKEMKEYALKFIPFNGSNIELLAVTSTSAAGAPLQMVVAPEGEAQTTVNYWVKLKPLPKKMSSSQEKVSVLVPFWILSRGQKGKENEEPASTHALVYKVGSVAVGAPGAFGQKGKVLKPRLTMRVVYLTNETVIEKGSRLVARGRPPTSLEGLEE